MTAKGDEYRAKEAECREHAKRSFDAAAKRTLEELAGKWHDMADRAERDKQETLRSLFGLIPV
jgi:hypothetical protein